MKHRPITFPDWYFPIRAARFGNEGILTALGLDEWHPVLTDWCLVAEAAENEAQAALMQQD